MGSSHQKADDMNCAIVIPVYKDRLTTNEARSLTQCLRILGHYPVILVAPERMNLDAYHHIAGKQLPAVRFADAYFVSVRAYSRLLVSRLFYRRFTDYSYILLYQLDAWVFRDELKYWMDKGYDYIGAPWIIAPPLSSKRSMLNISDRLAGKVGNGGFSLRKIRTHLRWCPMIRFIFRLLPKNEDMLWTLFAPFRKPTAYEALQFAFELEPAQSFLLNNQQLPFGCHGWEKYQPDFWKQHIS